MKFTVCNPEEDTQLNENERLHPPAVKIISFQREVKFSVRI